MLTACTTGTMPIGAAVIPETFMLQCPALPQLNEPDLQSLLANHIATARLYHLCSLRHSALINVLRRQQTDNN